MGQKTNNKMALLLIAKIVLFFILISSIFLFLSQDKVSNNLYGSYFKNLSSNFFHTISTKGPLKIIKNWFSIDKSAVTTSQDEDITGYKLRILGKSLNNYFASLLKTTDTILKEPIIYKSLNKTSYNIEQYKLKSSLLSYLKKNSDIMEVSLFNTNFEKISSIKYKSIQNYTISKKVFVKLEKGNNILIKSPSSKFLVLISRIKLNNQKTIGYFSQTLNPIFFTKILDFLNINDNLFYIKNNSHNLVLDNYSAFQYIKDQNQSFSYLFYKKLTRSKEAAPLTVSIDKINYSLGVILEENNLAGDLVVFLVFTLIVYLAILLTNLIIKHIGRIKQYKNENNPISFQTDSSNKENSPKKEKTTSSPLNSPINNILRTDDKLQGEIDKELDLLRQRNNNFKPSNIFSQSL